MQVLVKFASNRNAIYTTNAIESVNSVIRKFTKNRKIYPNEQSALKLIYMAIHEASKKWTMPIHHWKPKQNHYAIIYEGGNEGTSPASPAKLQAQLLPINDCAW